MTDTIVTIAGRTTRLDMLGTDHLTVDPGALFSVVGNQQTVRFTGVTTGAIIDNSGTIENTAGGRAIRFESGVGTSLTATINNLTASSVIQSGDDAFQIQSSVTSGLVTIFNAGTITSVSGQAIDFASGGGTFTTSLTNSGTIGAGSNDAVRFGGVGNVTNTGTIDGGTDAAYSGADGVQYEDNATGTFNNNAGGNVSGDRHAINAGTGSNITVNNAAGATLAGRNGSGVGSDGSGTVNNFGTITGSYSNSAGSDENSPGVGGVGDGINDGDGDGIDIDGLATINNHGTIRGLGAGGHGSDGLPNTAEGIAAGGGTITNFSGALIRGLGLGILIDDSSQGPAPFTTNVINQAGATIQGDNSFAIKIVSNLADVVDNAGTISGGGGVAILFGSGNNTLTLRNGSTITGTSDGGTGTDNLNYLFYTASGVTVNLTTGAATGTGGVTGFENVAGSDLADTLNGDGGANQLEGGLGNDTIDGAGGSDTAAFNGQKSTFTFERINATTIKVVDGNAADGGDEGTDTVSNVETLSFQLGFETVTVADLIGLLSDANAAANTVKEGVANGTTVGVTGSATDGNGQAVTYSLSNNAGGRFTINAASGVVAVANGGLLDFEQATSHTITVRATSADGSFTQSDVTILVTNVTPDKATGNSSSNTFVGGTGADSFKGGGGNDTLKGGGGNDTLDGGTGSDRLEGGSGNDTYFVDNKGDKVIDTSGTDTVRASISYTLGKGIENLVLTGSKAINGTGNASANTITGNNAANKLDGGAGNDILIGGAGNDEITGGAGRDRMTGGAGADDFNFKLATDSGKTSGTRDIITDFKHHLDDIDLSAIDANGKAAGSPKFTFLAHEGDKFTGGGHEVRWFHSGSKTIVEGDIDGNKHADFQIELTGKLTLDKTDFFL